MAQPKQEGHKGKKSNWRKRPVRRTPTGDFERDNSLENAIKNYQIQQGYGNFDKVSPALENYLAATRAQPYPESRQGSLKAQNKEPGGSKFKREKKTKIKGSSFHGGGDGEVPTRVPSGLGGGGGGGAGYDPYSMLPDPLDVTQSSLGILDELVQNQLADSGGSSYDYEAAMQKIAGGIRKTYGADIKAIRGNIKDARKDTKHARRETEQMYKGLAEAYGRDAQQAEQAGDNSVAEIARIGNEGTAALTNLSSQLANEQAARLQGLGVQAAAADPNVINPATAQDGINAVQTASTAGQTLEAQNAEANKQYFRRGRAGARMEGTDRSLDLLEGFKDYKRGQKDEIRGLKANRGREIAESNANIESQAAEMQAASDAETWTRLMDYLGMRTDMEQSNIDNMLAAGDQQWGQKMDLESLILDRKTLNNTMRNDQRDFLLDKYTSKTGRMNANTGLFNAQTSRYNAMKPPEQEERSSLSDLLPDEIANPNQIIAQSLPQGKAAKVAAIMEGLRGTRPFRTGQFPVTDRTGQGENVDLTREEAGRMAREAGRQAGLSPQEINILVLAAYASL